MNLNKHSFLVALFCTLCYLLPAQNILISFTQNDTLHVCNTDTFLITVQNNHAALLTGASLTVSLPTGLMYIASTVVGAGQQNISNLSAPIFGLPDVPANQSVTIRIVVNADCDAANALDAGQQFFASLAVFSALGNAQFNTPPIKVETGAILIQSASPLVLIGEIGDTLLRTICVTNTRIGKISTLHFDDSHQEGFEVSVAGSSSQTNNPTLFSAEFDGSFFESVGNGDFWLDQDESICFTELIIITSCGIPTFTNTSVLQVGWGCGGEVCRYDSQTVFLEILPSTNVPELVFEPIWAPPTDYCGNTPAVMGFKIRNTGSANAKDILLNLSLTDGLTETGVVSNSFRIATTTGSTSITPSVTTPTFLPACNLSVVRDGSFVIKLIAAGDSLQFLFDVITCVEQCEAVEPEFRIDYFFRKECPVNGFVSGNELIIHNEAYFVQGDVKALIGMCLDSGQTYPFFYVAVGKYLQEEGFWHLELDLPIGISFEDSCGMLLGNNAPVLFETTPLPNGGQNVRLAWATPLAFDSLSMDFCLRYECDTNIVCIPPPQTPNGGIVYTEYCCLVRMNDATYWSPALNSLQECAINDCHENLLAVNRSCVPGDTLSGDVAGIDLTDTIPGLRDWWNVYRLNLGYRDDNDDRNGDLPLSPPSNIVRRDRFLAGDTLRVEYCGVIDSAVMVDTISRAIWHEIVRSDMDLNGNDTFPTFLAQNGFVDSTRVRWISNSFRVRYADGTEASCSWNSPLYTNDKNYYQFVPPNSFPLEPIDEVATEKFYFLYSLPDMFSNGCIPKPVLELGDSIFIYTDFKIDVNFKPGSTNNPDPPLVGFRTATSPGGNIYAWNNQPYQHLQYSGWKKSLAPNTHSIKPCDNSVEVKQFRYSMRIARENMFPFEVRPLAWISDYRQTVPPGLELASATLDYLTLQDSVPFYSNLILPFAHSPGFLDIDFAPAFADPLDEGFTLRSKLTFKANCQFNSPDTSKQYVETGFFGCLNGDQMTALDSIKNAIGFFSNTPRLQLLTGDSVVFSPSETFEIDFDLKNLVIPPALAAWIAVVSPSGLASDIELFQMPQNQSITGLNNFFNIGPINGFSQSGFRLRGKNVSCETDSLLLIFGWNCTPASGLADIGCGRDTFLIKLNVDRPELELDVWSEPGLLTLCDTSDWFEFEIYNAKIGYAFDLEASVKLPQGLNIVPGSCQISYPEGAPWVNIPDPTMVTGNLFQWAMNDILPAMVAGGLPGVNFNPQNSFHIRFKTIAECGFVANTPIIYGTTGIEPCGRKTNVLNKPGDPIKIFGLNPTYGVQLSLQPIGIPGVACGAAQEFSVSLNILGTPAVGDSVYILLPQGVSFFFNSYTPGQNAPAGPPTLNAQGFQLPLPILPGGGTMQFSFKVELGAAAGCTDQIIAAQTRVKSVAFCQSLGAPCDVYISTGEATFNLDIDHPQLAASNANLFITNGQVSGSITITNIGAIAANGATVQIWQDADGNGTLSANDVMLNTFQTLTSIASGASVQLSGILDGLDSTQICGLLFVLPAEENCACDDQIFSFDKIDLTHTPLNFCGLSPVSLGVPSQAGFIYLWQPSSGLACATCPNTVYTPDPSTPPNVAQTLTLVESSVGCTVTHSFEITFGAAAAVITGNALLCEGTSTTLLATPAGLGYLWEGPGIQDPAQQAQTVLATTSSTYAVTITFPNGCTAIDSLEIDVLNADTLQLAGLTTCAGDSVDVFGTLTATAGTYQMVLENVNGCDSTIVQSLTVLPEPITEEQLVFCFGDSLLVFDSMFTESGQISQIFSTINGCDSVHIVNVIEKDSLILAPVDTIFGSYGQIITLTGPNGYITYIWQPTPTPPCPNCPSVTYPADAAGYQEYLLRVADLDGCSGVLLFRVVVGSPCSADSLDIPNAFTPNGDQKNDVFRVVAHEGSEVISSLEIYDRWGEKVYENQGNAFWDGTIDGQPAPSDVYVYIVKVTCGELVGKRVGDVTLLR
ncbi:MAG: gliding motility-associated C-terminal domain-containing protein [Saprospiraceae bacterium]|nr:gliding motility-associated C-terminal domain-containing protein [Saprospiraceae bacterium]